MDHENIILNLIEQNRCLLNMPSRAQSGQFLEELYEFLFPVVAGQPMEQFAAALALQRLKGNFQLLLLPLRAEFGVDCGQVTAGLFNALPDIYASLMDDARALLAGDPAAQHLEEVVLAYPGFFAIYVYRVSHLLYSLQVPILPRLLSEHAHSKTGIDIHPGAQIGRHFFIDHGTGIVIGETCVIGDNVKIYQGVTLGALSVSKDLAQTRRHPTIQDNVVLYAGSTILGGETVVGHDSVIGGNVWLTESVAPYSVVYHKSEVRVRSSKEPSDPPIDFVI